MKTLTMITRHGVSKNEISAYTLITSDYQTVQMTANEIATAIRGKKIAVTNLGVGAKGIEGTNGALDKYTLINAQGIVEGTPRAVVLDRVEINGKLVGYTVFTQTGIIKELNVVDTVNLCNQKLIANGKLRHTQQGDIVSSICGEYPLREIEIEKAPKGVISADILYFGTAVGTGAEYVGAIVSCTSAAEMSKITSNLNDSNAKIVASAVKAGGQKVRESLALMRMGANSIYGVFEITALEKLIKSGAKLQNKVGKITVSAVKYGKDSDDEATVTLRGDWKAVDKSAADSEDVTKAVKNYAQKIVEKFGTVKIQ